MKILDLRISASDFPVASRKRVIQLTVNEYSLLSRKLMSGNCRGLTCHAIGSVVVLSVPSGALRGLLPEGPNPTLA